MVCIPTQFSDISPVVPEIEELTLPPVLMADHDYRIPFHMRLHNYQSDDTDNFSPSMDNFQLTLGLGDSSTQDIAMTVPLDLAGYRQSIPRDDYIMLSDFGK